MAPCFFSENLPGLGFGGLAPSRPDARGHREACDPTRSVHGDGFIRRSALVTFGCFGTMD